MSVIIYRGWICTKQYNDGGPFSWVAYYENSPELTTSGKNLDELKEMIDLYIDK